MRLWWSQREKCPDGSTFLRAGLSWNLFRRRWSHIWNPTWILLWQLWVKHLWPNWGWGGGGGVEVLFLVLGTFWTSVKCLCEGVCAAPAQGRVTDLALQCVASSGDTSDETILWETSWSWIQADVFCAAERSLQCFVSAQLMRERECVLSLLPREVNHNPTGDL